MNCSVKSSSIKSRLQSKVVLHQRLSFIEGRLPSKVVFHHWSSSIEGRLPSKVVFHWRSSFVKGCLPSKVVVHQRLSFIKGYLPVHWLWLYTCLISESSNSKLGRLDSYGYDFSLPGWTVSQPAGRPDKQTLFWRSHHNLKKHIGSQTTYRHSNFWIRFLQCLR